MTSPLDAALASLLTEVLPDRRWFPAKGRAVGLTTVAAWDLPTEPGEPRVRDLLLALDGAAPDQPLLHVPVVLLGEGEGGGPGLLGTVRARDESPSDESAGDDDADGPGRSGAVVTYDVVDGPHHPAGWRALLRGATWAGGGSPGVLDAGRARVVTGEQSNTSVVLPGVAGGTILKVVRAVAVGPNPDLEVPRALADGGWAGVPRPLAWLSTASPRRDLAVLAELVPDADDGFELACTLAGHGASFDDLGRALGETVAQMHAALRDALPPTPDHATVEARWLVADLRARADRAIAEVPELAARAPGVRTVLDGLAADLGVDPEGGAETGTTTLPVQRIHGDLHLGQVLHGSTGWRVLDFEGEPLRPLAERTRPDLPQRDVAGMLRSFDYAAAVGGADDDVAPAWVAGAREAFLTGYREELARVSGPGEDGTPTAVADAVLRALELDKALYEAVYERRNRPSWLPIPVRGIDRIVELDAEQRGAGATGADL